MTKIYNDINESIYVFKYDNMVFYFSSKFYLEKFKKEYNEFLKDETMKLKIKYRCTICADEMILLLLYKRIEKRGFKVLYCNKEIDKNYYFKINLE